MTISIAMQPAFLERLVARDFNGLAGTLASEVRLRALLPGGRRELAGTDAIVAQFARWFGDAEAFEVIETAVDEIAGRLHLRWRLRLRAKRLGGGWFVVEQHAYADPDDGGHLARLDLLCSGYLHDGDA